MSFTLLIVKLVVGLLCPIIGRYFDDEQRICSLLFRHLVCVISLEFQNFGNGDACVSCEFSTFFLSSFIMKISTKKMHYHYMAGFCKEPAPLR